MKMKKKILKKQCGISKNKNKANPMKNIFIKLVGNL